ncbi:MAG: radical SAM protein [Candidatus Pacearchaeota archaeon]|jgi:hypothetical protein
MNVEKWWVEKRCNNLSRKTVLETKRERKYLLANLSKTLQAEDINKSAYTIGDFYRTKDNLKADSNDEEALEKAVVADNGFDMPAWAVSRLKGLSLAECNMTFMPQTKTCNVYCPWCFVDDENKNGKKGRGEYFSTSEIIDALEDTRKTKTIHVIRRSGGEPLLAPWQWLETLEEIEKRGLSDKIYFQGETNQTTGHFIDYLIQQGRLDKFFWKKLGEYNNFGVLCSFKGTDTESNLRAIGFCNKKGKVNKNFSFLDNERWYTYDRMVNAGIDAYPFMYDSDPNTVDEFLQKGMKKYGPNFVSKSWAFPLKLYGPEKERLKRRGIDHDKFQERLNINFKRTKEKMQKLVPKYAGHEYKEIPRVLVELKNF